MLNTPEDLSAYRIAFIQNVPNSVLFNYYWYRGERIFEDPCLYADTNYQFEYTDRVERNGLALPIIYPTWRNRFLGALLIPREIYLVANRKLLMNISVIPGLTDLPHQRVFLETLGIAKELLGNGTKLLAEQLPDPEQLYFLYDLHRDNTEIQAFGSGYEIYV